MVQSKSKLEISGQLEPLEIDDKRFYLDGLVLKSCCPTCKQEQTRTEYSLSFPMTGTPIPITFWCSNCEDSWVAGHIQLSVDVKLVSQPQ